MRTIILDFCKRVPIRFDTRPFVFNSKESLSLPTFSLECYLFRCLPSVRLKRRPRPIHRFCPMGNNNYVACFYFRKLKRRPFPQSVKRLCLATTQPMGRKTHATCVEQRHPPGVIPQFPCPKPYQFCPPICSFSMLNPKTNGKESPLEEPLLQHWVTADGTTPTHIYPKEPRACTQNPRNPTAFACSVPFERRLAGESARLGPCPRCVSRFHGVWDSQDSLSSKPPRPRRLWAKANPPCGNRLMCENPKNQKKVSLATCQSLTVI